MSVTTLITAEQLLQMPDDGCRRELVAGELRTMSPPGWLHCEVESNVDGLLKDYQKKHRLGKVLVGDPGFLLARDPDTVLAPDLAFIRNEHIPAELSDEGYWPGHPDLAVEVVPQGRSAKIFHEKARAWLDAGVAMVWVVHPARRTVTVYRPASEPEPLTEADQLDGKDVLPGFHSPVADLFRLG